MSKLYFMENLKLSRTAGYAIGLLIVAFLICLAPSMLFADDDSSALCEEPARDSLKPELSDEELAEKMQVARKDLIELRSQRHHARQEFAANDEDARAIINEMNELRRQLREKNAELEALMNEDERFAEWHEAEQELAQNLRALQEEAAKRD